MLSNKPQILVTGGAGYIGSHCVLELEKEGFEAIVLNRYVTKEYNLLKSFFNTKIIIGDIQDTILLKRIFASNKIDTVIHLAACSNVGESVTQPAKYYQNNFVGTLTLLETMLEANIKKFIFSSSSATYGIPKILPICEEHAQNPINPYGMTKLMVERIVRDFGLAYDLRFVCFRYFNVAGINSHGLLGESINSKNYLIPSILQTALGNRESISIFGTDYNTNDGTCIRDYVHVADIAKAHVLALQYLLKNDETDTFTDTFNLSSGRGYSVREVIELARTVTRREIKTIESKRHLENPPILIGSNKKAKTILGWNPQYSNLSDIIADAWRWHQNSLD